VYNHVLSSLANSKSEGRYETAKKIWEEMERENICSDATYKSLIRLFSKENQWGDVAAVRDKLNCLSSTNGSGSSGN
jgi:pentatricopeptide repeat protein